MEANTELTIHQRWRTQFQQIYRYFSTCELVTEQNELLQFAQTS